MSDLALKNDIEHTIEEMFLTSEVKNTIQMGSNFISLSEIKHLNWFVGVGANNKKETSELLNQIGQNSIMVLFGFLGLALLANFLHNIAYSRLNMQKHAYEVLLTHKARMGEIGELISGINHQFIQPVNSLKLILSSLIISRKNNVLDNDQLDIMLKDGQKSIDLLSHTIDVFRNFYKTSEVASRFCINKSIENLLTLMHIELSRSNVSVSMRNCEQRDVFQIENIIQQILLILLHNAKDALVEKYKTEFLKREIFIDIGFEDGICNIDISEFGCGISPQLAKKIFQAPKTTKKFGNGIGLYFGKKLANQKINGDIKLLSIADPTTFRLCFDINLKEQNV
ncbi:ATP-binding protein [Campylobacter suis]|uniref:Histidine kinase domain-containing protein n=1 Tax=Campylobacter suis TaxID=2790657 RepID=A0ABN7KBJ5_9BACT|nr:ATP-binding protein [Campylobacter suis]CAD7289301.1 hypothetical protein LMG8286_01741 [Campylobacter suis]